MISLLLDQGLPRRCAADLRGLGWDVEHVGDLGRSRATDEEILDLATEEGRAVVTLDSDFAKILARRHAAGPPVVHIRIERLDRAAATELLVRVLPRIEEELALGAIASVTIGEVRLRRLPLG